MNDFKIDGLDHVAIKVRDIEASAAWYERVLGLKKYKIEKWGEYPIFMLAGKTGVALFPLDHRSNKNADSLTITGFDHFAFKVTNENFAKAIEKYKVLNIAYQFQDHYYFHSIYTKDPDGHTVELTTIIVQEEQFYELE